MPFLQHKQKSQRIIEKNIQIQQTINQAQNELKKLMNVLGQHI
jgi:hypothetical protein